MKKRKILIYYVYSGYESCSKGDHVASVANMEDAIDYGNDDNASAEADDDKKTFSGILEITTTSSVEFFEDEDYLEMLKGYCESGYDNELGGYYEFELV